MSACVKQLSLSLCGADICVEEQQIGGGGAADPTHAAKSGAIVGVIAAAAVGKGKLLKIVVKLFI